MHLIQEQRRQGAAKASVDSCLSYPSTAVVVIGKPVTFKSSRQSKMSPILVKRQVFPYISDFEGLP